MAHSATTDVPTPTDSEAADRSSGPILFFDGHCSLCNAAVDFTMARSKSIRFAPLQGETAARLLSDEQRDLNSVALRLPDGTVHRRSTASLVAMRFFGGLWPLVGRIALLVPRFVRDGVYRVIAANRYRWFGKTETCRLPTPEEQVRFLP